MEILSMALSINILCPISSRDEGKVTDFRAVVPENTSAPAVRTPLGRRTSVRFIVFSKRASERWVIDALDISTLLSLLAPENVYEDISVTDEGMITSTTSAEPVNAEEIFFTPSGTDTETFFAPCSSL